MIIDFHNHFVPASFPELPSSLVEPAWPSMKPQPGASSATMFVGERKFREMDAIYWDVGRRIEAMDRIGTDVQVITPVPELISYWFDKQAAAILTDSVNRDCAAMVSAAPGRLSGFGIVAMQDVPYAVRQVAEIKALGLSGIFLGSHVNGKSIASEDFYPVWQEAERLGLVLFVHGIKPGLTERLEGPPILAAALGVPYEGTAALASFIATDIFGRFPRLQIVFAHGGGMLGSVIDRMDLIWEKFLDPSQNRLKEPPSVYARRFWYDTVVHSSAALRYVADRFGADRILAGTDGPAESSPTGLATLVTDTGLPEPDCNAILSGNAAKLLEMSND